MKRYRIIIIGAITLLIAIFIGFTVRINMIFPNAKDVTYTSDNPPIIDGLKITPVDYNVYTIDEYREKSGHNRLRIFHREYWKVQIVTDCLI